MKINSWLGILVFCWITALAVAADLPSFIDLASLLLVSGGASGFLLFSNGALFSDTRLEAASEGAVISGWLGSFMALWWFQQVSLILMLLGRIFSRSTHSYLRIFLQGRNTVGSPLTTNWLRGAELVQLELSLLYGGLPHLIDSISYPLVT